MTTKAQPRVKKSVHIEDTRINVTAVEDTLRSLHYRYNL